MKDGEILHKGSIDELINSMTEAVWECLVPKNKVSDFMEKYKISNMKSEINQVMLRIISHEKPVGVELILMIFIGFGMVRNG